MRHPYDLYIIHVYLTKLKEHYLDIKIRLILYFFTYYD